MAITSVTKDTDAISYVEDGVTKKLSVSGSDTVVSFPIADCDRIINVWRQQSDGHLIISYFDTSGEKQEIDIDPTATADLTGAEIVALLEALGIGSRLSHAKLDDVSASDHHAKTTSIGDLTDHDKAAHDALDIDSDTLDGEHAAAFEDAGAVVAHVAVADPHIGYRLESADHSHQTTGAQAGQLDHGAAMVAASLLDDDHTQYIKHSLATAVSDFLVASGAGVFIKKTLAEVKTVLGLGTAAYTAATDYVTHALATVANDFIVASGSGAFIKKTLAETLTILGKAAASGLASLNASTKVVEQPAAITDHLEGTPTENLATKAPTSEWAYDHGVATTGIHGVGTGIISSVSTANKSIYVDLAATGAADGTSWADAFTTIQAAVDSLEDVIVHAYTIKVREGATPYRETVYLNSNPAVNPSHLILGTLIIEAEYYFYGDCEANVGGAGEITDTGAFADVAIGDEVFILDLNGANGRAQDYELCTVDDISNAPNRIGTDGAKTPTTLWKYTIVRTEISGSDDGTDGGTARDNCFLGIGINNIKIYGFLITFSDSYCVDVSNCRSWNVDYCIYKDCDLGIISRGFSDLTAQYSYMHTTVGNAFVAGNSSRMMVNWSAITSALRCISLEYASEFRSAYNYLISGTWGLACAFFSFATCYNSTIAAGVTTGVYCRQNSVVRIILITNNATTPEDPAVTVDSPYIGV